MTTAELKLFDKELKKLYLKIDQETSTMWGTMDNIAQGRLRKDGKKAKEEDSKWKDETTAQLGYGEITAVSITLTGREHSRSVSRSCRTSTPSSVRRIVSI